MSSPFSFPEQASSWNEVLSQELQEPYMMKLFDFIEEERKGKLPVYPPVDLVFNAFLKTPYERVNVVILGQDPYHQPNQAHGLSFSVLPEVPLPPSLQNIFKELQTDMTIPISKHGCLDAWAEQGILLLNTTLTVRQGEPMSHHGKGWERFTDCVISKLAEREDPVIFILWGKSAQQKSGILNQRQLNLNSHFLMAPHPSPFSAYKGFFGSQPFSKTNDLLIKQNKKPIDWRV